MCYKTEWKLPTQISFHELGENLKSPNGKGRSIEYILFWDAYKTIIVNNLLSYLCLDAFLVLRSNFRTHFHIILPNFTDGKRWEYWFMSCCKSSGKGIGLPLSICRECRLPWELPLRNKAHVPLPSTVENLRGMLSGH